jgi:hypothetical protein
MLDGNPKLHKIRKKHQLRPLHPKHKTLITQLTRNNLPIHLKMPPQIHLAPTLEQLRTHNKLDPVGPQHQLPTGVPSLSHNNNEIAVQQQSLRRNTSEVYDDDDKHCIASESTLDTD